MNSFCNDPNCDCNYMSTEEYTQYVQNSLEFYSHPMPIMPLKFIKVNVTVTDPSHEKKRMTRYQILKLNRKPG